MASNRSPEMRKDPVFNRWIIFSPTRSRRPSDFKSPPSNPNPNSQSNDSCPFCLGREHDCAPEIFRFAPDTSPAQWTVRVIQNLYPAVSRDIEPPSYSGNCVGDAAISGFGFHDVVIESPVHSVRLWEVGAEEVRDVVMAYKKRILQVSAVEGIQYVQVFKNHGASAGASMSHSHSQIMALPVVPPTVSTRLNSMREYFDQTGKCSLCEIKRDDLLIDKSAHFISIVPFAAAFPFEIWIVPVDHSSHFHDIDGDKANDFGGLLKLMLRKISMQLNDPPFNFMIHSAPLHSAPSQLPYSHWFLQIVPQLSGVGGFEIGTGCYINPVFPEDAAKVLRDVSVSD